MLILILKVAAGLFAFYFICCLIVKNYKLTKERDALEAIVIDLHNEIIVFSNEFFRYREWFEVSRRKLGKSSRQLADCRKRSDGLAERNLELINEIIVLSNESFRYRNKCDKLNNRLTESQSCGGNCSCKTSEKIINNHIAPFHVKSEESEKFTPEDLQHAFEKFVDVDFLPVVRDVPLRVLQLKNKIACCVTLRAEVVKC